MTLFVHRILHPTDFSAESEQALQLATAVARDHCAAMIILHVVSPDDCREGDLDHQGVSRDSDLFRTLWQRLERLRIFMHQIPVSFLIKVGPIAETISETAQFEHSDLIVLSAHFHSYIQRQYLGSVSESVSDTACCPVLCLRPSAFHQETTRVLDQMRKALTSQHDPQSSASRAAINN